MFLMMNITIYMMIYSLMFFILSMLLMMNNLSLMFQYNLFNFNSMYLNYLIYIDWMSMMFCSTVMIISSMIIIYSMEYMSNELKMKYFFYLIIMFIISMILVIISPSIMSIILGWDMLGLISYLLVIYYQNKQSFNSGMITIISNRIGDISIIMMISYLTIYGSWNMMISNNYNNILMNLMLMISACTKSAQFPFSLWLPAAMAAPTPVSSLVHSSTLVTAGIYLIIRYNHLINYNMNMYMLFISSFTSFMAGLMANYKFDLKKIIAFSTLSQMGLMMFTISMKFWNLAFFHLITHALFKSTLFMCSGIMIHSSNNNQDIRLYGNLSKFMPLTLIIFNSSNLCLCGFPFLSGFYSKDMIIEINQMMNNNILIMMMFFMSIMLTILYTLRLMYFTFMNNNNLNPLNLYMNLKKMNYSLIILMLTSTFFGSMLTWMFFFNYKLILINYTQKIFPLINIIIMIMLFMNIKYMNLINNFFMKNIQSMWMLHYIYNFNKNNFFYISMNYEYSENFWIKNLNKKSYSFMQKILFMMTSKKMTFKSLLMKYISITIMFMII
uniref:NADH:ubiquinone reductase (H(+)-translocating) n=1 Tax=Ettchellsia sinica TaxID=1738633 RepID=A0A2S0AZQ7_9HYME|nr:NADH dehydrogenase subunit 5 [Ettchellsia sinica]